MLAEFSVARLAADHQLYVSGAVLAEEQIGFRKLFGVCRHSGIIPMSTPAQLESLFRTIQELSPRQREVIEVLDAHGPLGAWQISDITRRLVHAVRPRLDELKARGLVEECGARWEPRTERHEAVWKLVWKPYEQMRMAI